MRRILKFAGLIPVTVFFAVGGQAHFTATDFFVKIVPRYVPSPVLVWWSTRPESAPALAAS